MSLGKRSNDELQAGFSCRLWQPEYMPQSHRHQDLELNIILSGSMTYFIRGQYVKLCAGQFGLFSASILHQTVDMQPKTDFYLVDAPLSMTSRWCIPDAVVAAMHNGAIIIGKHDGLEPEERLCGRWRRDLNSNSPVKLRAAELELEAKVMRWTEAANGHTLDDASHTPACQYRPIVFTGSPESNGHCDVVTAISTVKAKIMMDYIASHYMEPIGIAEVAERVHLHPNYATSMLRRACGLSIRECIERERIKHAKQLLASTRRSVTEVALDSGFWSVSRFYAAFHDACGCSPEGFRKKAPESSVPQAAEPLTPLAAGESDRNSPR